MSAADLERRIRESASILEAARPHLEWVVTLLADLGAVVYLVDRDGVILWSDGASPELLEEAGASPGLDWSEAAAGTNAAGSALAADEPVYAVGGEQGEPPWRRYSAMAVPLHSREGTVAGVVVASSPAGAGQGERLALAAYAAFAVERHLGGDDDLAGDSAAPSADARRRQDEAGRFRRLLDAAPDATVLIDETGTILFANSQVQSVLGYAPMELLGHPVELLVPEHLRELHLRHRRRFFREPRSRSIGANFELRARRRDGSEIPVEINLSPVRMREGLLVSTEIRDVTARKEALSRLEIQYSLSCALAEAPNIAEAAPRLLKAIVEAGGWDAGELWLVDPDEKALRPSALWVSPSLKGPERELRTREFAFEKGEGIPSRVWREAAPIFVSNLTEEGNVAKTEAAVRRGLRSAFGFPITLGQKVIGVLAFFSRGILPLDDETLRMLSSLGSQVGQFIERRRAEEETRRLNAELERRVRERTGELEEALREMNAFSYTIAHDLRSPLRAIACGADIILEERDRLGEEARSWGRRIRDEATRMDQLVSGLLDYSRLSRQELHLEPVGWEQVVDLALKQLEREIREKAAQVIVERPLPPVLGHTLTLVQALANLLSNAVKFVPRGVVPRVRIRAERGIAGRAGVEPGPGQVRLWVEDNGIGISPDHRERIFGVFERLHRRESYPGTGIGLAIVKRVVDRMGGKAGVESDPGQGSRFYLDLPEAKPGSGPG